MRRVLLVLPVALTAFTACTGTTPPEPRLRTIAFDNLYGAANAMPVHVKVDGGSEQTLTATCDPKTCTIKLLLMNAKHDVEIAVEVDGRRSQPTRVTLDTSSLR